ncbi:hypothetical protein CC1G_14728 [Coprinopsis cinerea okayama7|uniref:Uncharacterized protein n=1 Tax=Coprinopsis cinerea (strain Okayama-7 / 130 / ATCC MYA-4618 / FGSC 9003) TaxID=240176 RepID=D6RML9_COPC7|nr:hypothetical protein CC1G_14728 [Coprinopsis cinerea okayama7\|eukprot:XP_002911299.1 hypothetical protein CC1G_14728 [Coprinopsis cinerea okayama7\
MKKPGLQKNEKEYAGDARAYIPDDFFSTAATTSHWAPERCNRSQKPGVCCIFLRNEKLDVFFSGEDVKEDGVGCISFEEAQRPRGDDEIYTNRGEDD